MPVSSRTRFVLYCSIGVALLLSACQPAAAPTQVAVVNTTAPTVQVVASLAPAATDTRVPDTPTALPQPSATTKPADTATTAPTATTPPTVAPTETTAPTETAAPTATKKPTARPTARPTTPPQPTATNAPVVPASIYSTATGGPQGYTSTLGCTRPGNVPCQPVMPPGDVAFSIILAAGQDAVPAIFVPFGLSVEKDGANVADMYMTVVSGWLNPGEAARLGTSRNFQQPGTYVIRTNGCYVTQATYPNCNWGTVNGTIVTFVIQ